MILPLLLGATALLALAASSHASEAAIKKIESVIPSKRRGASGRQPLVKFTRTQVYWRTLVSKPPSMGVATWGKLSKDEKGVVGIKRVQTREEVMQSPADVAVMASQAMGRDVPVTLSAITLATLAASEAGQGHELAKAAIMYAALTQAKRHGVTVARAVMPDGKFGGQQGRYASTLQAPTAGDIEIAEAVLAGKISNPAPGAWQWDSPRAQNAMLAQGVPGYAKDSNAIARERQNAGMQAVILPGVDANYLRLWRPAIA